MDADQARRDLGERRLDFRGRVPAMPAEWATDCAAASSALTQMAR